MDRFHIWPDRDGGGKVPGRFWCRQCGISGDTIAFLQQVDGLTYPQACAELGIASEGKSWPSRSRYQAPPATPPPHASWLPKTYDEPGEVWREKAENLLADCQERLSSTPDALGWLVRRGIAGDIARAYGLGYNLSSKGRDRYRPRERWGLLPKMQGKKAKRLWIPRGWVIPARNSAGRLIQLRVRRLNEDIASFASEIKYLPIDGSSMATMVLHPEAEVFVVVECGFDAILLAGITDGKIGAITTWNSAARPDRATHALLQRSTCILGGLDYDQGGDREQDWWSGHYRQYRRLPSLPGSAKDPGDGAANGVDLWAWLVDGLPRGLRIKLGFAGRAKPATAARQDALQSTPSPATDTTDRQEPVQVIEIELADGQVVYVTNNEEQWHLLTDQGLPVFSRNELKRLQSALSGMGVVERRAAIEAVLMAKREFLPAYICAGRPPVEG
ncbi:hypothetical protein [Desulfobulbus sp.]|uniref:hypothetical protein n=1 Tax=Desulfobulbus sp. TaxID=895 RepID=UPI00286F9A51|nr:hypothetical protein [Desulfobulbus sp.]